GAGLARGAGPRVVAGALPGALSASARLPTLAPSERQALASHFASQRAALAPPAGNLDRTVREVHPSFKDIRSWISSVGAGVALNDLDGDGLPNDLCSVDTRVDQVLVEPVPGTGARYATFVLDPSPLP